MFSRIRFEMSKAQSMPSTDPCVADNLPCSFRVRYSTINDDFLQSMQSMGCDIAYLRGRVQ